MQRLYASRLQQKAERVDDFREVLRRLLRPFLVRFRGPERMKREREVRLKRVLAALRRLAPSRAMFRLQLRLRQDQRLLHGVHGGVVARGVLTRGAHRVRREFFRQVTEIRIRRVDV